ncbi:MAG: hypothetical protein QF681_05150 [Vicinamibacterales bacterium]|jgi:hypothetical protein|nr:hypothetical protein [Vicinamibacterales bacterium]
MNRQSFAVTAMACAAVGFATVAPSGEVSAQQTAPGTVDVPTGTVSLGSVELPRRVMADGRTLASGTYDLRVTASSATPDAPGQLAVLERWVEFRQGDEVQGSEVVSIVPASEIDGVAKSAPPGSGTARVELLKDNDYLRVWVNQDNTHYFIHLVVG